MIKIETLKIEIEENIKTYFESTEGKNKNIYEAMEYSMTIGGKRIRPILALLTYSLYKDNYKDILDFAMAIEMIHTYSLIHDDLPCMDDDDLRRGKPTSHKVFGEAIAVLAGDGLLNEAMNITLGLAVKNGGATLEAANLLFKASGCEGMIGGQVKDILSEGKDIGYEELLYMHKNKTGALIEASVLTGAILGEASKKDLEILKEYGEFLGLAFQIKDDILDVTGDTKTLGKEVGKDLEHNKYNFITYCGLEKCKEMCLELTEKCLNSLDKLELNVEELKKLTTLLLSRDY